MRVLIEAAVLVNALGGLAAMVTRHLLQNGAPPALRRRPVDHAAEQERLRRENDELDAALDALATGKPIPDPAARPGGPFRYNGPTGPVEPTRLVDTPYTTVGPGGRGTTGPTGLPVTGPTGVTGAVAVGRTGMGATGPAAWFPLPDSEPAPLPPLDLDDESRLTGPRRRARRYRGPAA